MFQVVSRFTLLTSSFAMGFFFFKSQRKYFIKCGLFYNFPIIPVNITFLLFNFQVLKILFRYFFKNWFYFFLVMLLEKQSSKV